MRASIFANPFSARTLMKIDYVGALRAQRVPSLSGFSHPYSVHAPFPLWYESLDIVFLTRDILGLAVKGLIVRYFLYLRCLIARLKLKMLERFQRSEFDQTSVVLIRRGIYEK